MRVEAGQSAPTSRRTSPWESPPPPSETSHSERDERLSQLPARIDPNSSREAKIMVKHDVLFPGPPARARLERSDLTLEHAVGGKPGGVQVVLRFQKIVEVRSGKGCLPRRGAQKDRARVDRHRSYLDNTPIIGTLRAVQRATDVPTASSYAVYSSRSASQPTFHLPWRSMPTHRPVPGKPTIPHRL